MINTVLEIGDRVAYKESDDYESRSGVGIIVGYHGSLPPRCQLSWVLYLVQVDGREDEEAVCMWHDEIVEVLK